MNGLRCCLGLALVLVLGCGRRVHYLRDDARVGCEDSEPRLCACEDGQWGEQACSADGLAWEPCQCAADAGAMTCSIRTDADGAVLVCPEREPQALPRPVAASPCEITRTGDDGGTAIRCQDGGIAYVPPSLDLEVDAAALGPTLHGSFALRNAVDLSFLTGFREIEGDLRIESGLVAVALPNLERIGGALSVVSNRTLQSLTLPKLEAVGSLSVSDAAALGSLTLEALTQSQGEWLISKAGMLRELRVPRLTQASSLRFEKLPGLVTLSLVGLTELDTLIVDDCPALTQLELPALRRAHKALTLVLGALPRLSLPLLSEVTGSLSIKADVDKLELPRLREVSGGLGLPNTRTIDLPALVRVGAEVRVITETGLEALRADRLAYVGGTLDLRLAPAWLGASLPALSHVDMVLVGGQGGENELGLPALSEVREISVSCVRLRLPEPSPQLSRLSTSGSCQTRIAGVRSVDTLVVACPSTQLPELREAGSVTLFLELPDAPTLPTLTRVDQSITLRGGDSLDPQPATLDCAQLFPALPPDAYPSLAIRNNKRVQRIDCSTVTHVHGSLTLMANAASELRVDQLARIDGELLVDYNYAERIVFPALHTLGGGLLLREHEYLREFGAPLLGVPVHRPTWAAVRIGDQRTLDVLRANPPALVAGDLLLEDAIFDSAELSGVRYVSGALRISGNPNLIGLAAPDLRAAGKVTVSNNANLRSVAFPQLTYGGAASFCGQPHLPACFVDGLAQRFALDQTCGGGVANEGVSSCADACCAGQ